MNIVHRVFDWIGIPVLVVIFWILFLIESKFDLRKRVQNKWQRSVVNSIISIPSFILLRFMFLPAMIWLSIQNEKIHFGLNYLYDLPPWAEAIIGVLVFDYTNYLWHTLNHRIPLLWRFHLVHHTDPDLDLSTATRFHFGELIGSVFFRGAFIFLSGATPLLVIIYEIVFEAATMFHHSNTKLPIQFEKALNKIIVTPRMHGIHHSIIKNEADSNYSVIFSMWDRLHHTAKLNIHQDDVVIGVPAYHDKQELTAGYLLKLPFTKIRKWNQEYFQRNMETADEGELIK
ncbi:MAG TPA: sterol desaturase family protein [Chitinophagaceae bacterium]|nr:sterol desaturase family protein [Chitinophagaceae bacterium]